MKILRAFKTELDLTNKQRSACMRHAGAARFAYNWGLERKITAYPSGEKTPAAIDLQRELNVLKKTEFSWMRNALPKKHCVTWTGPLLISCVG